ncbi:hypothetical protein [Marinithermofilum abyssi]|nr:hypothetical protein [Marinithermofilum abyssi]
MAGLEAREDKIIRLIEQTLKSITQETKASRVEKSLKEIYQGWHTLQETRQLQNRIERLMDSQGKNETKSTVKVLGKH